MLLDNSLNYPGYFLGGLFASQKIFKTAQFFNGCLPQLLRFDKRLYGRRKARRTSLRLYAFRNYALSGNDIGQTDIRNADHPLEQPIGYCGGPIHNSKGNPGKRSFQRCRALGDQRRVGAVEQVAERAFNKSNSGFFGAFIEQRLRQAPAF